MLKSKMLKNKVLVLSMLAGTIASVTGVSFATTNDDQNKAPATAGSSEHMREHGDHMKKMVAELGLTEDQQAKMKEHHMQQKAAMEAAKADTAMTPEQKHAKMEEMRAENMQFMDGLLTPEQKTKWEAMKAEHKGHRHGDKAAAQPQG